MKLMTLIPWVYRRHRLERLACAAKAGEGRQRSISRRPAAWIGQRARAQKEPKTGAGRQNGTLTETDTHTTHTITSTNSRAVETTGTTTAGGKRDRNKTSTLQISKSGAQSGSQISKTTDQLSPATNWNAAKPRYAGSVNVASTTSARQSRSRSWAGRGT